MRKAIFLFICLLVAGQARATTYYATSSTVNIDTASLWLPTSTGTCTGSGTALVWANRLDGDVLDANGCTALAINVDAGGTSVQVTLQTNATTGGGFTLATADLGTMTTLHAHITAGSSTAVTLTGSTGCGTISGNITGGNTTSIRGIVDSHTSCTVTVSGDITGGSAGLAAGYYSNGNGPLAISGNVAAGSGYGLYLNAGAVVTLAGNCSGVDTVYVPGCYIAAGSLTVTGNLIFGKKGPAFGLAGGILYYTPAARNYILLPKDSSYVLGTIDSHAVELPTDPGVANVKTGVTYGSFTGTYSDGGGGTGRVIVQ
jgi:hypothetical protein